MSDFSKIMEQIKLREKELDERREELKDLVVDITEKERAKVLKKSQKDFFFFAKKVFPEYCTKPFSILHKDIHRFSTSEQRLVHVVAGPPEHGKTAILRLIKIWMALYGLKHYIIKVTETMQLSLIDLASIRLEFEENPRLHFLYVNLKSDGKWDEGAFKVAPTSFNKEGTWFEAFAYGVPPTGRLREQFRPDLCDIDDLENYRKAGNVDISKDKIEFINNDIIPRLSMTAPILWFGNNARKTMAINIIIEMETSERDHNYPAFRVHIYPAWDRKKNKPLWCEVFSFENEEAMRLYFGVGLMTWLGNYQQKPVVADGVEFKKAHWREYSDLPGDALGVMFCDPASGKSGCYKAAAVVLFSRTNSKFYITSIFCRQCDWEAYFDWMYRAYGQFQKHIRYIGWEKDFHQDQYILFRRLYISLKDKPELPIRAIESKGHGQKEERIRTLAVPYEMGNILFHKDILLSQEGIEAQTQLIGFPDYSYQDFPDALANGYREVFNIFAGFIGQSKEDKIIYESLGTTRVSRKLH